MNIKRKILAVVGSAGIIALTLAACSTGSNGNGADGDGANKSLTMGLVIPQGDKYFQGITSGMETAAAADSTELITVNSNSDSSTEATNVQNLLQRKVDAVLMQPATSAAGSIATMKSVKEAGVALICYGNCTDEAASPDLVEGVVQSDNTALGTGTGEAAAKYIKENLDGKAVIGILNCDSFEVCKLRKSGFKEALKAAGVEAEYVADQEAYLADKATPIATNLLLANPEINIIWAANEGGTIGAVTAALASSKSVVVFGTDITDQLAEYLLKDGNPLQATTGQDPEGTAAQAYKMAVNAINGVKNDPFEILVPGTTYSRTDPSTAKAYLG